MQLTRPQLRRLLNERYRTVSELMSFLLDYHPEVHRRISSGMDRLMIENLLLECVRTEALTQSLQQAQEPPPLADLGSAPPRAGGLASLAAEDLLRAEIRRQLDSLFPQRSPQPEGSVPKAALEALISQGAFVDVGSWLRRMEEITARICLLDLPGIDSEHSSTGTGFLIGPDLILTNYHVIDHLLARRARAEDAQLIFDYRGVQRGSTHRLSPAWCVAKSPMSPVDHELQKSRQPSPDELDFAVLRIAGNPSQDRVMGSSGERPRGYLPLRSDAPRVDEQKPLFILQHPQGQPLKLHVDTVKGENENGTRLRYTTNTLPGSSGSPCLDAQLRLVALHHSRDPADPPRFNEGIPIRAIVAALARAGVSLPS
jgi:hypothetical protein